MMKDEFSSIGEIVKILKGSKAPEVFDKPKPGAYPYLQIEDLRPDATPKFAIDKDGTLAKKTDVLIAWDGANAGTIGFDLEGYIGSTIAILRPTRENIHAPYLGYFLRSKFKDIQENATGATIPHVSRDYLENLKLPLPPLTEQKRITSLLARADRLRQLRRTAHELSDSVLQSVFLEMFGKAKGKMKEVRLETLAEVKTGGTPSREVPEYFDGQIPWVKTTEVINEVIYDTSEKISEAGLKASNCEVFPVDTILLAMYGQGLTRGRTGKLAIPATTNQACAAILPSSKINTDYLWTFLKLSYNEIRDLGRGGNQPNLNLSMVRDLVIPVPPLNLQEEFAGVVRRVESLRGRMSESERQVEGLFEALLAQTMDNGR